MKRENLIDIGTLLVLFGLSSFLYIGNLGFYSDDWSLLREAYRDADQTFFGAFRTDLLATTYGRPVYALLIAVLQRLFGMNPLPYHLVNHCLLGAAQALFLINMQKLSFARPFAFAAAALFVFLPHYSTFRFWISTLPEVASILLFFLSLWAGFCHVQADSRPARIAWAVVSFGSMIASLLCFEVMLPVFAINTVLWWRYARLHQRRAPTVLAALTLLALPCIGVYKAISMQDRLGTHIGFFELEWWLLKTAISLDYHPQRDFGFNLYWAVITDFFQNGLLLPRGAVRMFFASGGTARELFISLAVGSLVFASLKRMLTAGEQQAAVLKGARGLLVAALGLYFAGYAIFLLNMQIQFSPTGIANRTAVGGAIGVALILTAAAGLLTLLPVPWFRPAGFSGMIAVAAFCGTLILNCSARFWEQAYQEELAILNGLKSTYASGPPTQTLMLTGVCSYLGPAPVFESWWDFSSAIALMYNSPKLPDANVVTPRIHVKKEGLVVEHYRRYRTYPYGSGIGVWDASTKRLSTVHDEASARQYFDKHGRMDGCPPATPGLGVTIY